MSAINDRIKKIPKLYHASGCSDMQVKAAEKKLNIKFPQEYIDYVKEYGAISFYGTEWTGINVDEYINVVNTTEQERNLNAFFPTKCFVLENLGVDGIITIVNEKGNVFNLQYDKLKMICETITEYLDICIARNK